jgi:type II secretory pathway component PulK
MYGSNNRGIRTELSLAARTAKSGERGVALITALAMLLLFSLLGSAYVGYMLIERSDTAFTVSQFRGRHAAEAGVQAAIGALHQQMDAGLSTPATWTYLFPVYGLEGEMLAAREGLDAEAFVEITDENARVNINFAPRGVLERILGVDRATARQIRSDLPRIGDEPDAEHMWFTSVEELATRGYLNDEQFGALNRDLLTVYTAENPQQPEAYINLNTASPEVIAAVLNVPLERAAAIAAGPALRSLHDVVEAAGHEASAFNVPPAPDAPAHALPAELTFQSRTYRIISIGRPAGASAGIRVEAVVLFRQDGRPEIRYWSSGRKTAWPLAEGEATAAPPVEESAAPDVVAAPEQNPQSEERVI